jgi:hypothetical protein
MTEQLMPQPQASPKRQGGISRLWVLAVLAFGILLGVLLALSVRLDFLALGPDQFFMLTLRRALQLHVILSTLEMVLLFSLVLVYVKVYAETRANFSMGILIVLFALLVHSILSFPLTVDELGPVLLGSGAFFPYPDIFTIIAYTIFLYLSLG